MKFTISQRGYAMDFDAMDIADEVNEYLFVNCTDDGTVTTVYENRQGRRVFRAMEYTLDEDGEVVQCYGYSTSDKYHMGERYRGLFGKFEEEVFGK